MPMDAACCLRASELTKKELVKNVVQILKPYLQQNKNSKDAIDVIKELLSVSQEFAGLLDIYHNPSIN